MAEAKKAGEEDLSMEEILQSIRKIIAEDGEETPVGAPATAAAPASDVLELTEIVEELPAEPVAAPQAVNDVLSKIDQVVVPEAPAANVPATPFAPPPAAAAPAVVANGQAYIDSLLSTESASATSAAFKKIHPVETPIVTTPSPHFRSGGSVEDLIMEALRPMLKQWLDTNLPTIVERIVEREIKKLVN